ncbi:histidine kinase dimerization/phosphoacceptor domain-containing protein [Streptomyces ginkgonis]|uniref:histidine kinase dimerization/phosphoacceptor domain-containing protein n=1 Tax=Streptomyces ginkgonis TaxID=1812259 RepID=UPI0021769BF9|nr:histidine kinase dimerization/phosphoacceptor domain-containing protein [Streptomyces ginkgonis]
MDRIRAVQRRFPINADTGWAALLLLLCGWHVMVDPELRGVVAAATALVLGVIMSLAVALRRRSPEKVLLLALVVCVAQILVGFGPLTTLFAVFAAIATAASRGAPWAARLALLGGLATALLAAVVGAVSQPDPLRMAVGAAVWLSVPFTLSWALGNRARFRRRYRRQLDARAASQARLDATCRRAAQVTSRVEICREMYDITGHRLAGMVVQADAAGRVLDSSPERAGQALGAIAEAGHAAEGELRQVGVLLRRAE